MKQEDIQTKIDVIVENLEKLGFLKAKTYEYFTSDFRNIDSAIQRFLRLIDCHPALKLIHLLVSLQRSSFFLHEEFL